MTPTVRLSSRRFLAGCAVAAAAALIVGFWRPFSGEFMALEVMTTILALFVFGSTRYQLDKNALTYGSGLVVTATFIPSWWPASGLRAALAADGPIAMLRFIGTHLFTLRGLDELFHADTMLFILGLTYFVAVIAQTRILESISFAVLRQNKGRVLPTVTFLVATVSIASGILAGISMIGLMIRTLVIILFLSKTKDDAVIFAVIISTVVTTVCGMWLAYGEPPNLIMKANLEPHLTNGFFIAYCLPVAFGSFLIVFWNLRKRLKGRQIDVAALDVLDVNTADVRFLQAARHGEVLTPIEFVEDNRELVGARADAVIGRLHLGEPLGEALLREGVAGGARLTLLGKFVSVELAAPLDEHYGAVIARCDKADDSAGRVSSALADTRRLRIRAQRFGIASFVPFIALLIMHSAVDSVSLFWSSVAGFVVAYLGISSMKNVRNLALHEAKVEYVEYFFLFPLFMSMTLLQKAAFFDQMGVLLRHGIESFGTSLIAIIQYAAACFLSALLDNNIVADFASRALHGLDIGTLHLFSMAQIAGYAAGGCWTHIGSAQSVVAYAFIRREVDENYTPFQWMKLMTPIMIQTFVLMLAIIYSMQLVRGLF